MTVCIAAICESGKTIVVAADRMFTNPALSTEFETDEQKIERIGNKCVALPAGNSVFATEVLELVQSRLGSNKEPRFHTLIESVRNVYSEVRARKAEEIVISPILGADFQTARVKGVSLPNYLEKQEKAYQQVTMMQNQQNFNADIIIAGIDEKGAHICQITHPGVTMPLQKLGYATIGSGAIHAMLRLSLSGQTTRRNLVETLAEVYIAKRQAEVAPGVGKTTDMAIIRADGGIRDCSPEVLKELDSVYETFAKQPIPDLTSLKATYDKEQASAH
jgi:20S proteasome alpha/beta subunit